MDASTPHVELDERLTQATYPLDEETAEETLYTHGPQQPKDPTCRVCGHIYTPDSPDCPSVLIALAVRN